MNYETKPNLNLIKSFSCSIVFVCSTICVFNKQSFTTPAKEHDAVWFIFRHTTEFIVRRWNHVNSTRKREIPRYSFAEENFSLSTDSRITYNRDEWILESLSTDVSISDSTTVSFSMMLFNDFIVPNYLHLNVNVNCEREPNRQLGFFFPHFMTGMTWMIQKLIKELFLCKTLTFGGLKCTKML